MTTKAKRKPASTSIHSVHFPGETAAYRKARDRLLEAEIELRRNIEAVAALRRKLPPGGPVPQDYEFEEGAADLADTGTVRRVKLSESLPAHQREPRRLQFHVRPEDGTALPELHVHPRRAGRNCTARRAAHPTSHGRPKAEARSPR